MNKHNIQSKAELLGIREQVKHSKKLNRLQPETVLKIRQLRLNRRKTRCSKRGGTEQRLRANQKYLTTGANLKNLVKIKSLPSVKNNVCLNFFTVNARSLLNKAIDVRNFICEKSVPLE